MRKNPITRRPTRRKKPVEHIQSPTNTSKRKTPKRWDAIIEHVGKRSDLVGAEIGVDTGKTCKALFEQLPGLFLFLVDRWIETPAGDSYFQGARKLCHEPQSYFDKAFAKVKQIVKPYRYKILKEDSVSAAEHVQGGTLDFCFIDGDHSYEGTKRDIEAWLPKVKDGGWLCGHDYDNQNTIGDVKKAIDEAFGNEIELSYNTTWFYRVQ